MQDKVPGPGATPAAKFPPSDPLGRDNNFNFLRLLFASFVIVSHSAELVDGDRNREPFYRLFHHYSLGGVAVDGFFLLSGFLILQSWQRRPHLGDFLKKRVLRIYPGFIAAYLISSLVVGPLASDLGTYFHEFKPAKCFAAMLCLETPSIPDVFAGAHFPVVNGSMWTIPYEFRCYLLVPVLAFLGFDKRRLAWLSFALVVLVGSTFGNPFPSNVSSILYKHVFPEGRESAVRLLASFCMGGSFYLFRSELRYKTGWAVLATAVLLPCLYYPTLFRLALGTAGAYLLFWLAFKRIPLLDFFKRHSDISYGLYLYGWPVQSLLIWYVPRISPWMVSITTLIVAGSLGWLSWRCVELPFLRLKPRHDPRDTETRGDAQPQPG